MVDKLLEPEHLKDLMDMVVSLGLVEELDHEQVCFVGVGRLHEKGKKVFVVAKYFGQTMDNWAQLARMPPQAQDQGRKKFSLGHV